MKGMNYSDAELADFIVAKNEIEYFELLYDRYASFIYNKCFWFVNNEEDAKDLTQEIFVKIYLNLSKFKGDSKLSTWIYSVTLHTCIKYKQKEKNKVQLIPFNELEVPFHNQIYNVEDISYAETLEQNYTRLQEIINLLPPEEKAILLMKYQDNLPVNKIVEVLNVKESAVKMRLLRIRKKIAELRDKTKKILQVKITVQ